MYYVPDGTEQCGYYECKECGSRFLDLKMHQHWYVHTVEKRQIWRLALKNQGRDDHIFLMQFVSGHVYTGPGL